MDVKIFLIFIFEIYSVALSENCICYVGYAKDTGEVDLELESCIMISPTIPSTKDSGITTISTPTPTNETANPTTMATTVSSMIPDTENITVSNVSLDVNSTEEVTDAPQTPGNDKVSTNATTQATDEAGDAGKSSKRKRRDAEVKPSSCCQISILRPDKVRWNVTGWTANFSCSQNPTENAEVCNGTGCNDLVFLKRIVKDFKVSSHCKKGIIGDQTKKFDSFLFESDKMFQSCNNFSRDKCSGMSLTNNCPQEGICCCPLPKGICKAIPSTSAGSTLLPRGTKQPRSTGNSKKSSFDWKVVGYIATGIICGVFLTIVGKFIYGKGKKNRLRIPNYKYSRLRADYVAEDQEL